MANFDINSLIEPATKTRAVHENEQGREISKPLYAKSISEYNQSQRAGVVQWQNGSFPSFGRGFDSHRPLHKSR